MAQDSAVGSQLCADKALHRKDIVRSVWLDGGVRSIRDRGRAGSIPDDQRSSISRRFSRMNQPRPASSSTMATGSHQ